MRFRFTDDANLHEKDERQAAIRKVDEWWAAFATHADKVDAHFSRGLEFDVPQFMGKLSAVDERLMWEFGPPLKDGIVLELTPEEKSDYRRQDDLLVGTTAFLPMWQRAHSELPFASERFSRCGETFCYLKMDGGEGLDPQGFADRGEIEDALENALAKDLGAVIGGGTGLRYSYVDLALLDVKKAVPAIREALRAGRLPKRSWLLFHDSALEAEWIGIWDDSPPPPGLPV